VGASQVVLLAARYRDDRSRKSSMLRPGCRAVGDPVATAWRRKGVPPGKDAAGQGPRARRARPVLSPKLAKLLRYDANLLIEVRPLLVKFSSLSRLAASVPRPVRAVLAALLFLATWAALNASFNHRYPARELEKGWYFLLPSVDVCVVLGVFTLLGWWRRRLMFGATLGLAVAIAIVRLYRIADGLIHKNYFREVKLYVDLPLLPDLWRLLYGSVPLSRLLLWCLLLVVALTAMILLTHGVLVYQQHYLARGWRQRGLFLGVLALCGALSPLWPAKGEAEEVRHGLFVRSVAPLGVQEVRFASSAALFRRAKSIEIRDVQDRLASTPSDLSRLKGADFLLFLVESYGSSVFRHRTLTGTGCPNIEEFTNAVSNKGYFAASKYLLSTTYGGGSWFAHSTLRTGVAIRDSLEYALIQHRNPPPPTMALKFKQAGYRTVLVQPGTTRPWPEGLIHGFDRRYYAFDMDYEGPTFGWATMPDQYTIHVVHGKEMEKAKAPLFVEYALVSSHAPWTPVPVVVDDWAKLDRGRIFKNSPGVRFPVSWTNMEEGAVAYAYSLCYDFDVMKRYIADRLKRDAFIVILGDHQPPGAITYDDPSWAVPLHVLSRDRELIDRFIASGYTPGMIPTDHDGKMRGLQHFLSDFLTILSGGEEAAADRPPSPEPPPPGGSKKKLLSRKSLRPAEPASERRN
jgi:hypothetical protein